MDIILIFSVLGLILALGFLAELFFKKSGVPDVLLLILLGMALRFIFKIDPVWLTPYAPIFTTFALLFILFQGSLSIDILALAKSAKSSLKLTFITFIGTVFLITLIGLLIGFPLYGALLVGIILGGTSSIVIVPLLQNMTVTGKTKPILVLESALTDVLCIVLTVAVLDVVLTGNASVAGISRGVFSSLGLSILVGSIVGVVWIMMLERFTTLSRAYIVNIGIVLMLYAFVEGPFILASGPIACLTFGLVLKNSQPILNLIFKEREVVDVLTNEAKNFYTEISFFLKAVFFVYLGILLDLTNVFALGIGALIVLLIYLLRPVVVHFFVTDFDVTGKERTLLEVMVPKGLAASVLAQFVAVQLATIDAYSVVANQMVHIIQATIFFSIIATSVLVFFTSKGWFKGVYYKIWSKKHARRE
jgi:potassium/hydrogen antiporter